MTNSTWNSRRRPIYSLSLWERAGVRVYGRRGVTIIEVLFSILITSVGLLGAIALFPVASAQAKKARLNDDAAASGRAAFHKFDTMGMRRPFERWYTWNPGSTPPQFVAATPVTLNTTQSYCIDSRFVVRNTANTNWDATNLKARYFPYMSPLNAWNLTTFPHMNRIAFFPGTLDPANVFARDHFDRTNTYNSVGGAPAYGRNLLLADSTFQLDDDLTFIRPGLDDVSNLGLTGITNDRSIPAFQIFPQLTISSTTTYGPRPTLGHLSWMATLVPKIDVYSVPAQGSDEFVLSIVVFNDRPTDLFLTTGAGGNDNLLERTITAIPQSDGSTGGEFLLTWTPPSGRDDVTAAARLKVRSNDWLLLGGMQPANPTAIPRFHWYRVTDADEIEWNGTAHRRYVTLMGQDWDTTLSNQQATLITGVVAVYEKTIRLDYGSTF